MLAFAQGVYYGYQPIKKKLILQVVCFANGIVKQVLLALCTYFFLRKKTGVKWMLFRVFTPLPIQYNTRTRVCIHRANFADLYIGFTKLLFTVASLY
jgi:hypothetical protein